MIDPAKRLGLLVVSALLAGCALVQNTPKQDYVWDMGRVCDSEVFEFKMERVEADGRYWIKPIPNSTGGAKIQYFDCMNQQFKAHPYLDWLKSRQAATPTGSGVLPPTAASTALSAPVLVPVWKMGDEWEYAYKSPSGSGTYVWSIDRLETFEGAHHYVIKSGTREILYRVSDLASSVERVDGSVVLHHTPARMNYSWPLTPGKVWDQNTREERPVERQTRDSTSTWTVEGEETVAVPAGTFQALKIVARNRQTSAVGYEMWYAPAVKQWVKIREFLRNGVRERELISFKLH